ncbi:MAG: hypothetical protein LBM77_04765 [Spirochaetaceae bacterium]|jgi:hypothetical protein|nr:hypothetical protein [Spirochaetaceae bacterium]
MKRRTFIDPRNPGETWAEYDTRMKDVVEPETIGLWLDLDCDNSKPKSIHKRFHDWLVKIGFFRSIHYGFWVELPYTSKRFFQHHFDREHIADDDIWNLSDTFARWMYPRLKRFIKSERHSYPSEFAEYHKNEWKSREEYDKAITEGRIQGGGPEAWEKTLQEMLFWFEWKLHYEDYKTDKQRDDFCKKWGLKNPHAHVPENKSVNYYYKSSEPGIACMMCDESDRDKKEPDKYTFLCREVHYFNVRYESDVIWKRAKASRELFGKHLDDLVD